MSDAIRDLGQAIAVNDSAIYQSAKQLALGPHGNQFADTNKALAGAAKAGIFAEAMIAAIGSRLKNITTVTQK